MTGGVGGLMKKNERARGRGRGQPSPPPTEAGVVDLHVTTAEGVQLVTSRERRRRDRLDRPADPRDRRELQRARRPDRRHRRRVACGRHARVARRDRRRRQRGRGRLGLRPPRRAGHAARSRCRRSSRPRSRRSRSCSTKELAKQNVNVITGAQITQVTARATARCDDRRRRRDATSSRVSASPPAALPDVAALNLASVRRHDRRARP